MEGNQLNLSLEQQIALAGRPALVAAFRAAVFYIIEKTTDKELRETILSAVSSSDFPREVASAVLEMSSAERE
jgi:hypothetical protein